MVKEIAVNTEDHTLICKAEGEKGKCSLFKSKRFLSSMQEAEQYAEKQQDFDIDELEAKNKELRFIPEGDTLRLRSE